MNLFFEENGFHYSVSDKKQQFFKFQLKKKLTKQTDREMMVQLVYLSRTK